VPCGIPCRTGYRAVRHTVPCGIPCRAAYRAVRDTVPCGIPCRAAYRAMRHTVQFVDRPSSALRVPTAPSAQHCGLHSHATIARSIRSGRQSAAACRSGRARHGTAWHGTATARHGHGHGHGMARHGTALTAEQLWAARWGFCGRCAGGDAHPRLDRAGRAHVCEGPAADALRCTVRRGQCNMTCNMQHNVQHIT
jgi:hypothetical protein